MRKTLQARTRLVLKILLFVQIVFIQSVEAQIDFVNSFEELFTEVQMKEVFKDSKTFPDCIPLYPPSVILAKYRQAKDSTSFNLKEFILSNFKLPPAAETNYKSQTHSIEKHIESLWPVLTRQPDTITNSSLIPLPYAYVVPGGRFREVYYWDSYFTILGLQSSGKKDLIRSMINNFSYLIDQNGFIPNGNRTYYLSRSQPPFYSLMVKLLSEMEGDTVLVHYLPELQKEYSFWMDGESYLAKENNSYRRVVLMKDGEILNRYWDDNPQPRTESYREDILLAQKSGRNHQEIYRNIRAACESGWDFSSRWLKDGKTLTTIHTTEIVPVDLNALLYHLELVIAKANLVKGDMEKFKLFKKKAENRRKAIIKYCWNPKEGFFYDYDFKQNKTSAIKSLAALYPLFFGIASDTQARSVSRIVNEEFFFPGGVTTTLAKTGQQWDSPNGWAPLQWITVKGLQHYQFNRLAINIRNKWMKNNLRVYKNTGRLVEKYNVKDITLEAGGGEYTLQDGFGWSNGVLSAFIKEYKKSPQKDSEVIKLSEF